MPNGLPRIQAQDSDARPEIDRRQLRDLLLASLDAGTVAWNQHVVAIEPVIEDRHRLQLKGGDEVLADLVIGCEGTGS